MGERTDSVKDTLSDLGAELDYQLANDDWAKESTLKKPLRREIRIAVGIGALVAVAMVVVAATLFTHTFPSGVTGARLTTSCSTLTMGTPSVITGTGTVRFNCGSSTAALAADGSGPVTPSFNLATTLYTQLAIVTSAAVGTACSGGTVLTSNSPVTPAAGSYDYCATYVGSGALTGFTLTWSQ